MDAAHEVGAAAAGLDDPCVKKECLDIGRAQGRPGDCGLGGEGCLPHTVLKGREARADCQERVPQPLPQGLDLQEERKKVSYLCAECGKHFTCSGNLKVHLRSHTGETPFICADCGNSFSQLGTLRAHQRIHKGESPYACSACGKSFRQSGALAKHQRTHTGGEPVLLQPLREDLPRAGHADQAPARPHWRATGGAAVRRRELQPAGHPPAAPADPPGRHAILLHHLRLGLQGDAGPAAAPARPRWRQRVQLWRVREALPGPARAETSPEAPPGSEPLRCCCQDNQVLLMWLGSVGEQAHIPARLTSRPAARRTQTHLPLRGL